MGRAPLFLLQIQRRIGGLLKRGKVYENQMRLKNDLDLSHSIKDGLLGSTIIASICIPTFNRYHHLTNLLRALRAVDFDQTAYEILIIDNSDDTVAKTDFYNTARLEPNINVLHSSPPGVSRARNVGMEAARGRYVLFIDDDTVPIPIWLREIVDAFESCPDATVIGGPIRLIWPEGRPSWIPKKYECYLSALDHGTEFRLLANTEYLLSANMAFRADVLREFGGFPIDLGRRGETLLISNEEIKLQDDLRKAGCAIYYTPRALVYHTVDKERLDQGWLRRRLAWQSVSDAIVEMRLGNTEQYLAKAATAAGNLQIDHSFVRCFAHSEDPEVIATQLEFLTWFTKAAISSHANLGQHSIEAISSKMRARAREH